MKKTNRPIAQCHFTDEIVEVFDIKYGVITVKYPDGTFISEDLDCNSYYFPTGQSVSNLLWLAQNGANI